MEMIQQLNDELLVNKVLDKYGEALRRNMTPEVRARFDALCPDQRRQISMKKLNEVAEHE